MASSRLTRSPGRKKYRTLGLAPNLVYSDLHAGKVPDTPMRVCLAQPDTSGEAIPTVPQASARRLDAARIASIRPDTDRVSAVLANIFTADAPNDEDDSDGLVGKLGAEMSRPMGNVVFGAAVSATWADSNHMQSYFGVTAAQSAASGLAQYDAGLGFKRVDLELSATYMFAERWMLRGQVAVGELIGDAADSPIVQDVTQSSAGLFLAYKF